MTAAELRLHVGQPPLAQQPRRPRRCPRRTRRRENMDSRGLRQLEALRLLDIEFRGASEREVVLGAPSPSAAIRSRAT
jgi:hypothetical protein